jgi:hypothetical protein
MSNKKKYIVTPAFWGACLISFFASSTLFANNSSVHTSLAKATNTVSSNAYAFEKCRKLQAKPFDNNIKKKKAIIIGDSQGCDLLNSALENGYLKNYQIQFRFIPYPCQTVPGEYISKYISPKHRRFCTEKGRTDSLKIAKKQAQEADVIIFSSLWKPQVAQKLHKVINYLKGNKRQKIIVVGNKFFGKLAINNYFHMSNRELRSIRNEVGTKSMEINSILENKTRGKIAFVDPHKLVCGNSTNCPIFTNNLRLISYDGRHLTKAGARYMGKIIFQNSALGRI